MRFGPLVCGHRLVYIQGDHRISAHARISTAQINAWSLLSVVFARVISWYKSFACLRFLPSKCQTTGAVELICVSVMQVLRTLIRAQYGWRTEILYVVDRIDIVRLLLSLVRALHAALAWPLKLAHMPFSATQTRTRCLSQPLKLAHAAFLTRIEILWPVFKKIQFPSRMATSTPRTNSLHLIPLFDKGCIKMMVMMGLPHSLEA
jgi:hypothetical protein